MYITFHHIFICQLIHSMATNLLCINSFTMAYYYTYSYEFQYWHDDDTCLCQHGRDVFALTWHINITYGSNINLSSINGHHRMEPTFTAIHSTTHPHFYAHNCPHLHHLGASSSKNSIVTKRDSIHYVYLLPPHNNIYMLVGRSSFF